PSIPGGHFSVTLYGFNSGTNTIFQLTQFEWASTRDGGLSRSTTYDLTGDLQTPGFKLENDVALPAPGTGAGVPAPGPIAGYGGKCISEGVLGGPAVLWPCPKFPGNYPEAVEWTVKDDGSISWGLDCLDVAGSGKANGTRVQPYLCNGTAA